MKLKAIIVETVHPKDDFIIVKFHSDDLKQHFKVMVDTPFNKRMKIYDEYLVNVKWKSIVMPDINENLTYETILYCEGIPITLTDMMRREYK